MATTRELRKLIGYKCQLIQKFNETTLTIQGVLKKVDPIMYTRDVPYAWSVNFDSMDEWFTVKNDTQIERID